MKHSVLRILDIRDSPWLDGPGRTIIETAAGLRTHGIEITVASFVSTAIRDHDYLREASRRNLNVLRINEKSSFDPHVAQQIRRFCVERKVHLIHSHELRSNLYGLWVAKSLGIPAVSTVHGWIANNAKGLVYKGLDKFILRYFDRVIAVSGKLVSELRAVLIPAKKIIKVPNAIDTKAYHRKKGPSCLRKEIGKSSRVFVGKIGRLSPEKGQSVLLEALKRLLQRGLDIHLVLVGVGSEEKKLKELTHRFNVADSVSFAGFRNDMQNIYGNLDVVVQSSMTEGMPNVILEAMAMECPIVATDVGGTGELIDNNVHGLLVRPGDASSLADALELVVCNPEIARIMALRARDRVCGAFDSSERLRKMLSAYRGIDEQR